MARGRFPERRSPHDRGLALVGDPIAATRFGASFAFFSAERAHAIWVRRISAASCSTQPLRELLAELLLREARAAPRSVEHDSAGTGVPLVERET